MAGKGKLNPTKLLWIDTYNQITSPLAGTIRARYSASNMWYISYPKQDDKT